MEGPLKRLWVECNKSAYIRWHLRFALEAIRGETASVMLLTDEGDSLVFCASVGENANSYLGDGVYEKALRVPISGEIGINPLVVLYGKPISMEEGDPRHNPVVDQKVGTQTHALYAIPLATGERVVGTFSAINPRFQEGSQASRSFLKEDMEAMNAAAEAVRLWILQRMEVKALEPEYLRSP